MNRFLSPRFVLFGTVVIAMLAIGVYAAAGTQRRANSTAASAPAAERPMPLKYPVTGRIDHADDYYGVKIADPYRWLEDLDSPQTRAWVEAQNKVTFAWLERLPIREQLRKRLTELWNYERFGLPVKRSPPQEMQRGGRYFFTRNDGLQNQNSIYVADSPTTQPKLLIDPNLLSADGTVALTNWEVSEDGRLLAYDLAEAGSDWRECHVLEVETGRKLSDHLKWTKFSGLSWTPDNKGFYYSRYDEPPAGQKHQGAN